MSGKTVDSRQDDNCVGEPDVVSVACCKTLTRGLMKATKSLVRDCKQTYAGHGRTRAGTG
jgi:hypothetical protein